MNMHIIMHWHLSLSVLTGTVSSHYLLKGTKFWSNDFARQTKFQRKIVWQITTKCSSFYGRAECIFNMLRSHSTELKPLLYMLLHFDELLYVCYVLSPDVVPFSYSATPRWMLYQVSKCFKKRNKLKAQPHFSFNVDRSKHFHWKTHDRFGVRSWMFHSLCNIYIEKNQSKRSCF